MKKSNPTAKDGQILLSQLTETDEATKYRMRMMHEIAEYEGITEEQAFNIIREAVVKLGANAHEYIRAIHTYLVLRRAPAVYWESGSATADPGRGAITKTEPKPSPWRQPKSASPLLPVMPRPAHTLQRPPTKGNNQ